MGYLQKEVGMQYFNAIIWLFILTVDFLILWSIIVAGLSWIIVVGIIICLIKLFKKGQK